MEVKGEVCQTQGEKGHERQGQGEAMRKRADKWGKVHYNGDYGVTAEP